MTQNKTETVTGFIEKLEALQRLEMEVQGHKFKVFLYADVQKTIEQAKVEQSEPVAWLLTHFDGSREIVKKESWQKVAKVEPLYTAPQPTPQDVIDAERYRWLRNNAMKDRDISMVLIKQPKIGLAEPINCLDQAIDQAMKGE